MPDDKNGAADQDGAKSGDDSGQQAATAQQQQQAGNGAAAGADAGSKPDGSSADGGQQRDPYELMAELLGSDEGKSVLAWAAQTMNDTGGSAPPASGARDAADRPAATGERAELERKAEAGDGEAALELLRLRKQEDADRSTREALRSEEKAKALAEFVSTPAVQSLPEADRIRIGKVMLDQGAAAGFEALLDAVTKAKGPAATAEQQKERANQNEELAKSNQRANPDLPGGSSPGGPPPIEIGRDPQAVLSEFFSWKDSVGAAT